LRWIARHWQQVPDAVQDVGYAVAAAVTLFGASLPERPATAPLRLAVVCAAIAAPLALRRRLPVTAALLSTLLTLVGAGLSSWSAQLVTAVALSSAAYHRPRWTGLLLAASIGTMLLALFTGSPLAAPADGSSAAGPVLAAVTGAQPLTRAVSPLAQSVMMGIAPVAVGYALRLQRDRADQVARLRLARAAWLAAETRTRIAREVHDAVGHHLTAIRLQASAAQHVLGREAGVAGPALQTITETATLALSEVRALLASLNDDPVPATEPCLSEVDGLAARLATPACAITVAHEGGSGPLPAPIDQAAYRLVQEALTNAVRHSGADLICVRIHRGHTRVTVDVEDNGPTCPPPEVVAGTGVHSGYGLDGMRARTADAGGRLLIRPARPHGWRVTAVLPATATGTWIGGRR
jgi:signal transduction histidine kinase